MKSRYRETVKAVLGLLLMGAGVLSAQAGPYAGDCDVLVGPTSDPQLTKVTHEWTRHVIDKLQTMGVSCELHSTRAWARANRTFAKGDAEVLFPEIVGDRSQPGMTGMPVAKTEGFVIVTPKQSPRLSDPEALSGSKVGIIRGRFYPGLLRDRPGIKLEKAGSLEQNVDKLLFERIDATIEYQQDMVSLIERKELGDRLHYGEEFGATPLAYRFHLTTKGAKLMEHFNIAISELVADGTYRRLFKETSERSLY